MAKKNKPIISPGLQTADWKERVFLSSWLPYMWICLIGLALYSQTILFDFSHFDDNLLILDHHYFLSNLSSISQSFKQDVFNLAVDSYYRPILTISFIMDAQFLGISPIGYHLSNIIIHLIASCLLFLLLIKLKYPRGASLFFTLFFTVHPVLAQAVCWIPGRNDSLLGVYLILSFIVFIEFIETKRWKYYLWHMIFFALAMFTKELTFILPIVSLFYLHFIVKEKLLSKTKLIFCVGWAIIIVIWYLARQAALAHPLKLDTFVVINSMLRDLPAIFIFLGKTLFPFNLSVLPILKDSTLIFGIITFVIIVIALVLSKTKRTGFILFGAVWFLAFLIPSFVTSNISIVSFFVEHRIYIPLIGFIIILLELDFLKRKIFLPIGILILIILSAITVIHSQDFKDKYAFWNSAVLTSPHSPLAHKNLGLMYFDDGKLDLAEAEYKTALSLNPNETLAHNNLGLLYMDKKMYAESEAEFKKELALNPQSDKALFNLGVLYFETNNLNAAEEIWRKNLEANPLELMVHNNLGLLYIRKNMLKEAEEEFKKELKLNPYSAKALFNLGLLYQKEGKLKEAEETWIKNIQINPNEPDAYKHLVLLYMKQNNGEKAKYYIELMKQRGIPVPKVE